MIDVEYTERNLLRPAGRYGNTKRSYLLLNALQGKHLPAAPGQSLLMMRHWGHRLAADYGDTRLIIGFAETATAIGAEVAACFDNARYIHTTREERDGERIVFREEHSHAVEHTLCVDGLEPYLSGTVLFVDDEFSTGRTLRNAVRAIRERFPSASGCRMVGAALLSRLDQTQSEQLAQDGIEEQCLLKLTPRDYDAAIGKYELRPASPVPDAAWDAAVERLAYPLPDPRRGVDARQYKRACRALAQTVLKAVKKSPWQEGRILVLGTEECMYPALWIGRTIERAGFARRVQWYATTRSPIGVCKRSDYPVRSGVALRSLYDERRTTYLYNLPDCDLAVVCTDAAEDGSGTEDLIRTLSQSGCAHILLVRGACDV